jgi:hypothetical protein
MASEERKAADRKIEQDNLHNSLGAAEQAAETEAFQCGRCKQVSRGISYTSASDQVYHRGNVGIGKLRRGVLMNR